MAREHRVRVHGLRDGGTGQRSAASGAAVPQESAAWDCEAGPPVTEARLAEAARALRAERWAV
eukprot:4589709-Alexandrium_andersonii.AAC.1